MRTQRVQRAHPNEEVFVSAHLPGGLPLLVAPPLEPGMLGIWPIDTLDEERKRAVGRGVANQVQYYAEKLVALGVEDGPIRFASGSSPYEMSRDEFLHWATEYAINVGITLEA